MHIINFLCIFFFGRAQQDTSEVGGEQDTLEVGAGM